jgi:TonB family protein
VKFSVLSAACLLVLVCFVASCGTNEKKETAQLPSPDDVVAVDSMPALITMPPPAYPEEARRQFVEGRVVIKALIGKDGKVVDAFIAESDSPMFDAAALSAVKQAVFTPALQNGTPVAVWMQIPREFKLDDFMPKTRDDGDA